MRAVSADLLKTVSGTYAKNLTYKTGNLLQQVVNTKDVLSPPLIKYIDTFTDAALTPLHCHATDNGRLFVCATPPAGQIGTILCYTFNYSTGAYTFNGGIKYTLPNTASYTIRQIKVFDSGVTGWKITLSCINTTTANGGLYMVNNIALSDFTLVGFPTIPAATTGDTQASKKVFALQEPVHALTAAQGHAISSDGKIYVGNNVIATYQTYKFDPYATISTVSASGITTDCFVLKTGTTGTAAGMLGTILLLNNFDIGTPTTGPNAGNECLYVPGSTGFNEFRLSDVTSGATSIPSLRTCNVLDVANTNTALTPAVANWSNTLQRIVFSTNTRTIVKQFVSNQFEMITGYQSSQYRTGVPNLIYDNAGITISSMDVKNGWVFYTLTTAGQIGVLAFDLRSDQHHGYSYFTTKVMDTRRSQWISLRVNNRLRGSSNPLKVSYRGSNNYNDTLFDSPTGGWTVLANDYSMSELASFDYIQLKGEYYSDLNPTAIFAQPSEIRVITQPKDENDLAWRGDFRNSVQTSPARVAFSQVQSYDGSKHWEVFGYVRDTGALYIQKNTQDHASDFEISANDGVSYSAVGGAIASSPLLNVLRLKLSTPPGVVVDFSIREKA